MYVSSSVFASPCDFCMFLRVILLALCLLDSHSTALGYFGACVFLVFCLFEISKKSPFDFSHILSPGPSDMRSP